MDAVPDPINHADTFQKHVHLTEFDGWNTGEIGNSYHRWWSFDGSYTKGSFVPSKTLLSQAGFVSLNVSPELFLASMGHPDAYVRIARIIRQGQAL
jgi:hypothetical protein